MHYLVPEAGRQTHIGRRLFPTHYFNDFTAENALIEIESFFASAAGNKKIGREFHSRFSCSMSEGPASFALTRRAPSGPQRSNIKNTTQKINLSTCSSS